MSEGSESRKALWRNREVQEGVRKKSEEIFGNGEVSDEGLDTFFLLDGEKLSEQEKRDIALFVKHIGERLVHAILNRPGSKIHSPVEAIRKLEDHGEEFGIIPLHDPAHCITAYERSARNSVIPAFFRYSEEEAYMTPTITAEEFPALLWSKPVENLNFFTSLLKRESASALFNVLKQRAQVSYDPEQFLPLVHALEEQLDPKNFANVRKTYEEFIILFIKTVSKENTHGINLVKRADASLDESVRISQTTPDEKYLAFAQRLFNEYKTNKRIYIDEFERILEPLLRRLRVKDDALHATKTL